MNEQWKKAQQLELKHWQESKANGNVVNTWSDAFRIKQGYTEVSKKIMQRFMFKQDQFINDEVIDLGCGPTGRTMWLNCKKLIGVDPLLADYADLPWAQLEHYDMKVPLPAETRLTGINAAAVFCINVLDHCARPAKVIMNAAHYLQPGGIFFLSVDIGAEEPDDMHPHAEWTVDNYADAIAKAGMMITRVQVGRAFPQSEGTWLDAWGGGMAYHFWIMKRGD
jgi:SAM-dependent methyltransferase